MKLLFVYPPSIYLNHSMFKHFTYYAETIDLISKLGYEVSALDCGVELFERRTIYKRIKQSDVVIFMIEPYTIKTALSLSKISKELNAKCKIILYGTAAALVPNYLSSFEEVDFIVADGFFYEGIKYALEIIESKKPLQDNSKVLYGKTFVNIKKWGNPISQIVPLTKYQEYGNNMFEFTVQTGCPYNCSFCSEKILFQPNRTPCFLQRPVEDTLKILHEASTMFSSVYFSATTFTFDREWVLNLCDGIIKENIQLPWRSDTRIDCLDKELIKAMKQAGLTQLSIGIESFENKLLKKVNKGINAESMEDIIHLCQNEGVSIKALLILGIPGQTADDILHTQNIVNKLKLPYRWKEYSPIKELYLSDYDGEDIEKYLSSFDRTHYNTNSIMGLSPEEYMNLLFPDNYYR